MKWKATSALMLFLVMSSMVTFLEMYNGKAVAGDQLWDKTYGGTNTDRANSMIQTSDGGYVLAGATFSYGAGMADFWLVRTDSAGNQLWNKTYGGTKYDEGFCVVQTIDGGYAIAGTTYSAVGDDFWLVRTDAFGNQLWNKTFGDAGLDRAYSIVQTSDRGFAIAGQANNYGAGSGGSWLVKTDSEGNLGRNYFLGTVTQR